MKNASFSTLSLWILGLVVAVGAFSAVPARVAAFDFGRIIDPACVFACDNSPNKVTKNYTYTNSNNVNSNINSPGASVVGSSYAGDDMYTSGGYGPNYATPSYSYDDYPSSNTPLGINCYPDRPNVNIGETVRWYASAWGGNGSYNYSWTGTNGLSGSGTTVSKSYSSSGTKNATVTVRSGGQSKTYNCDPSVHVYDDGYDYDDGYHYDHTYPLSVSCSVDTTYADEGDRVTWRAYVSGGDGDYDYDWDGTDGLSGSGRTVTERYDDPGNKYASVTVRSDGRRVTANCSNYVVIGYDSYNRYPVYYQQPVQYPVYQQQPVYPAGLDVGCFADPSSARVNQPVTWTAEVTGGYAPYTYSWSGTDGLSGSQSSIIKYYGTTGSKSAVVTVTSADGRTGSRACTNEAAIRSAATGGGSVAPAKPTATDKDDNNLSAASLFSLANVPWGWVAILVILVLFATVLYLLFNRTKI